MEFRGKIHFSLVRGAWGAVGKAAFLSLPLYSLPQLQQYKRYKDASKCYLFI